MDLAIVLKTVGNADTVANVAQTRLRAFDPTVANRNLELPARLVDRTIVHAAPTHRHNC